MEKDWERHRPAKLRDALHRSNDGAVDMIFSTAGSSSALDPRGHE